MRSGTSARRPAGPVPLRWPRPPVGARSRPWPSRGARRRSRRPRRPIRPAVPANGRLRSLAAGPLHQELGAGADEPARRRSAPRTSCSSARGRCHRRSSSATSMARPMVTSTWRASTTLATSPARWRPGRGRPWNGRRRHSNGPRDRGLRRRVASRCLCPRDRRTPRSPPGRGAMSGGPARPGGRSRGVGPTTVTHSSPGRSAP